MWDTERGPLRSKNVLFDKSDIGTESLRVGLGYAQCLLRYVPSLNISIWHVQCEGDGNTARTRTDVKIRGTWNIER